MPEIKLYNQDCIVAMESLIKDSISLIVTDPPYNLGKFMRKRDTNLKKMRDNFLVRRDGTIWNIKSGQVLWMIFLCRCSNYKKRRFYDCFYGNHKS